ncbi:thiamine diphosphokinase [Paenibacillus senegalimassiliensis]|uniref:thiamine diphosphokinase n=1 Tax=Paenibacillus senegalimassiliensis TaxID=1737426 RepID=UPI00073F0B98|nr:thiamine diphosphokinase [Paenibacillus senegalimassiliensis]
MTNNRVLIFAGGRIDPALVQEIREDDYTIGADRGALFLVEHGIKPNLAVGDFDSVSEDELEIIRNNSRELTTCDALDKDLTDTELAFDLAIRLQPQEIILVGVLGTRMDHTLANIHILLRAVQHQIACSIWDEYNHITLTGTTAQVEDRGYTYVSLLPITPEVTGITLDGFLYPLDKATLKMGQSLAVSNKLIASTGTVKVESGWLLIIQSRD